MRNTGINLLSVIPMRKEPSHRSEMVSQLLFGEYVELLEEEEQFVRVKCLSDNYEGWVQADQLNTADEMVTTGLFIGSWTEEVLVKGHTVHAPMCSPVYIQAEDTVSWNKMGIRYLTHDARSYWDSTENPFTKTALESICQNFLDTPYLWGGKSVFGIDCSGFVQQVFKMFGIKLLRDAYLQAEQGSLISHLEETRPGDLAFFHNKNGRVIHVGIITDGHRIIHASGKVRTDTIDKEGIVNRDTGKRTHYLHSMRRYF
jgi:gamma-D-glutamyl-L-lysine dipeptidyl-peptidase